MRKVLTAPFFNKPTLQVAPKLLGKSLVRKMGKREITGIITEVEAYVGPQDHASHAFRGRTPRSEVMFGKPRTWYVYLIYGMHYCLNIVTEREGYPAAILIRSVAFRPYAYTRPRISIRCGKSGYMKDRNELCGPGRVCKYFKINRRFNQKPAHKKSGLWIENRGIKISSQNIKHGKRIGVDYAGKWKDKLWRFWIKF